MAAASNDVTTSDHYEGKLCKRGKVNKAWKERYFVVNRQEQTISYYPSSTDAKQKKNLSGTIDLALVQKIEVISNYDIILIKQLPDHIGSNDKTKSNKNFTFQLISAKRTFILAAATKALLFEWLKYLQSCLYGKIIKQGWLKKQGAVKKAFKKRYFVLNKYQQMKYYDDTQKNTFLGLIDCKQITDINHGKVYQKGLRFTLELHTPQRKWIIVAQDQAERLQWAQLINIMRRNDWKQELAKRDTVGVKSVASNSASNLKKIRTTNVSSARIKLLQQTAALNNDNNIDDDKQDKQNDLQSYTSPIVSKLPADVIKIFSSSIPVPADVSLNDDNDIGSCVCFQRLVYIFKNYDKFLNEIATGSQQSLHIKTMYEQVHELPNYNIILFLNDFYYLINNYDNELIFNEIYKLLNEPNINKSLQIKRIYRNRSECSNDLNKLKNIYFGENDHQEIAVQQIIDKIYTHIMTKYHLGFALTKSQQNDIDTLAVDDHDDDKKDDNDDDAVAVALPKLNVVKHLDDDDMKSDPCNYFVNKRLKLINDIISDKRENLRLLRSDFEMDNNKYIHLIDDNNTNISSNSNCNFGQMFYYWNYYKINRKQNDPWNNNYKYGDLYCEQFYQTFKLELINNKISSINILQWNILTEKANKYIKCDIIKCLKANNTKIREYGIHPGTKFNIDYIIAVLMYCNFDGFRRQFLSTFHAQDANEDFESMKTRHRQFGYLSKLLREVVACFSEEIAFKTRTLYLSVDNEFMFINNNLQFRNPLSASSEYCVISNYCFSNKKGIILNLSIGNLTKRDHLPYFNCEYLSDFGNESEKLLSGGNGYLKLNNIIQFVNDGLYDYIIYQKCIQLMNKFVNCQIYKQKTVQKHLKTFIIQLINNDNDIPQYIHSLFNYYCEYISNIRINLNIINRDICGYLFFADIFIKNDNNNEIKLDIYLNLFKNIRCIELNNNIGDGVFLSTTVLSPKYFENVLTIFTKSQNNIKLNKMVLISPDETKMTIENGIKEFNEKFTKINWNLIKTEKQKTDTSKDNIEKDYFIKILTFEKQ